MKAGVNHIDWTYNTISTEFPMTNAKLHINSKISDAKIGSHYLGLEISNFYLGTTIPYHRYMRVQPSNIPQEIWYYYDINISFDSYIYIKIRQAYTDSKNMLCLISTRLSQNLHHMNMNPQNTPSASGDTNITKQHSSYVLTTLASIIPPNPMPLTLLIPSKKAIQSSSTMMVYSTASSPSSGTTTNDNLAYICLDMSTKH